MKRHKKHGPISKNFLMLYDRKDLFITEQFLIDHLKLQLFAITQTKVIRSKINKKCKALKRWFGREGKLA
jgi:hypothetical protein